MPSDKNNILKKLDLFDNQHNNRLAAYEAQVTAILDQARNDAARIAATTKPNQAKVFNFAQFPQTKARIDKLTKDLFSDLATSIKSNVRAEWDAADLKNDDLLRGMNKGQDPTPEMISRYGRKNLAARDAFQNRIVGGLTISDRVWNLTGQFRSEIEAAVDYAITQGIPANKLATEIQKYLKHPDKLFRRVRGADGKLRLSKPAQAFHPGQGVYRSSYKNARRLAATETNIAYRTADHLRWQDMDFILGIEVKLSNNHTLNGVPFRDICDTLAGRYPKDFKFTGWHPLCRCRAIPILASQEEFIQAQQELIEGREPQPYTGTIDKLPKQFTNWMMDNNDRIQNAKTLPYFIRDNKTLMNMVGANEGVFGVGAKYTNIDDVVKNIDIQELQKRDNQANSGRTYQGYLGEMQGYNGLPKLVDNEDFNNLSKDDNYVQIFRGFRQNGDELTDSFKHGKLYEGLGAYGDGSYFGTRESVALSYTTDNNRNHVISAMFDRRAVKIADYDELKDAWNAERDIELGNFSAAAKRHFNVEKMSHIDSDLLDAFEVKQKAVYGNFGSWCTCKGYDMIYIKSEEFYVMLNRTKLLVRE